MKLKKNQQNVGQTYFILKFTFKKQKNWKLT